MLMRPRRRRGSQGKGRGRGSPRTEDRRAQAARRRGHGRLQGVRGGSTGRGGRGWVPPGTGTVSPAGRGLAEVAQDEGLQARRVAAEVFQAAGLLGGLFGQVFDAPGRRQDLQARGAGVFPGTTQQLRAAAPTPQGVGQTLFQLLYLLVQALTERGGREIKKAWLGGATTLAKGKERRTLSMRFVLMSMTWRLLANGPFVGLYWLGGKEASSSSGVSRSFSVTTEGWQVPSLQVSLSAPYTGPSPHVTKPHLGVASHDRLLLVLQKLLQEPT